MREFGRWSVDCRMSAPGTSLEHIFPGPSELSKLMRGHDWSSTSLGPPQDWPQGLRVPLGMMLTSRFEMWLGWGPDIAFFYNDAYVPTLGSKHPGAVGQPMRLVWKEVFAAVEDRIRSVMIDGVATWDKALLLGVPLQLLSSSVLDSFLSCWSLEF